MSLAAERVPDVRVRDANGAEVRRDGSFVLYWMTAYRRLEHNFALQRAVERARELERPLLILEALSVGYPRASDRLHRFVLDGMAEHARRLEGGPVQYHPYVEPEPGAGQGLVETLAAEACLVVADDHPAFFLPRMLQAVAPRLPVRVEAVDSTGLLPLRAAPRAYERAHDFRRFLQRELRPHLEAFPLPRPLEEPLPEARGTEPFADLDRLLERWPAASPELLEGREDLAALPIDHDVPPVPYRGGPDAAGHALKRFLDGPLDRYAQERNDPGAGATSGLSGWLHFGHLSVHAVFEAVAGREGWDPSHLADRADGARRGWWDMGPGAEAFLDELVTWRELGHTRAARTDDYGRYEALPEWARETLELHEDDPREHLYELDELEAGATADPLWNAAQGQLLREGRIHNYLRMLWGKIVLTWSPNARAALRTLVELNDRWAVDGRDPNSWSGIAWCLGRHDRPWPERAIFGKVRSMTSASTRRKFKVDGYIERYVP